MISWLVSEWDRVVNIKRLVNLFSPFLPDCVPFSSIICLCAIFTLPFVLADKHAVFVLSCTLLYFLYIPRLLFNVYFVCYQHAIIVILMLSTYRISEISILRIFQYSVCPQSFQNFSKCRALISYILLVWLQKNPYRPMLIIKSQLILCRINKLCVWLVYFFEKTHNRKASRAYTEICISWVYSLQILI